MIKKEWKMLVQNRFLIVVLIAIVTIPALYTTIFLSSMWDPYGQLSKLPVAVVNLDNTIEYQKKEVHIGNDLVESLKKSDSLKFYFVDAGRAKRGLKNGTYYMVLTIPADFSKNAVTLMDAKPKKMNLNYETNPGMNFIASKMSESAAKEIKDEVSRQVTAFYAKNIMSQFGTIKDGFQSAMDGEDQLTKGIGDLQSGQSKIVTGMKTLSDKTTTFSNGVAALESGMQQYQDGVETLKTGNAGVLDGTKKLSDGLNQLNASVGGITLSNVSLSDEDKAKIASSASSQTASYASDLSGAIAQGVSDQVKGNLTSDQTVSAITAGMEQDAQIQQMEAIFISAGYTKDNADQMIAAIVKGTLNTAASGISKDSIQSSISQGVSTTMSSVASKSAVAGANGVIDNVNANIATYQTKLTTLKSATQSLLDGSNQLLTGTSKLSDGTNQLSDNGKKLLDGIAALKQGSEAIHTGTVTLYNGANTLSRGLSQVYDGSVKLKTGLQDGKQSLDDSTKHISDKTYNMFSDPIRTIETKITTVHNNGSSMSAYMMTIAIWVAGMSFCMMYPIHRKVSKDEPGISFWIGKASVMYPVAILFSLVMIVALYLVNGLRPIRMTETIVIACLSAIEFISILYFFNVVLKKAGTYLMFIFMVVQLAGSTGTYPAQLSASFVHTITNYLPFTYTIRAFRSSISGGNPVRKEETVMLGVLVGSLILTAIYYLWKDKKEKRILLPELEG